MRGRAHRRPSSRGRRLAGALTLALLGLVAQPTIAAAGPAPAPAPVAAPSDTVAAPAESNVAPPPDSDVAPVALTLDTITTRADTSAKVPADDADNPDDTDDTDNTDNTDKDSDKGSTASTVSAPPTKSSTRARRSPVTFTPRAEYWIRGQSRLNSNFDPKVGDRESAILQRVRLGLLAETGPLSAYVELQDSRTWGFESSTISNQANVDLHQGYLELRGERGDRHGSVRLGRQEIEVGSRRLFVNANWHPLGQSFDALRIVGQAGRFGVDTGLMVLDPPRVFTAQDPSGDPSLNTQIRSRGTLSAYAQLKAELYPAFTLEGLVLSISERPSPAAPTAERDIVNAGLRLHGAPLRGLTYDVEAYAQAGRNLGLRHRAWATFATAIYTFPQRLKPGLSLRYNYASGQACTGDPEAGCGNARSGEFYRFFGLKHARYGILDRVGHSNLRDLEVGAHLRPHELVQLNLAYHFIQLDQPTGRWATASDALVGEGWDPTNTSRDLAHEVDLTMTIRPWKKLFIQPAYGVFVPLEAARRIAGPEPQHYVFLWMIAKF